MNIRLKLTFHERAALRLLNWLARENRYLLQRKPKLPGLYASGVVYRREKRELWCDYAHLLEQGWEDCDGLSAARAGELMARGARALGPEDPGHDQAHRLGLTSIPAEVLLTTRTRPGQSGTYHCIVRYRVGQRWYRDDPSLRLGMHAV